MLKPITEAERAKFTLKTQFQRGVEELLADSYESGYTGYLDIWPVLSTKDKRVIMSVSSKKVGFASSVPSDSEAIRYHIIQGKGCKRIK